MDKTELATKVAKAREAYGSRAIDAGIYRTNKPDTYIAVFPEVMDEAWHNPFNTSEDDVYAGVEKVDSDNGIYRVICDGDTIQEAFGDWLDDVDWSDAHDAFDADYVGNMPRFSWVNSREESYLNTSWEATVTYDPDGGHYDHDYTDNMLWVWLANMNKHGTVERDAFGCVVFDRAELAEGDTLPMPDFVGEYIADEIKRDYWADSHMVGRDDYRMFTCSLKEFKETHGLASVKDALASVADGMCNYQAWADGELSCTRVVEVDMRALLLDERVAPHSLCSGDIEVAPSWVHGCETINNIDDNPTYGQLLDAVGHYLLPEIMPVEYMVTGVVSNRSLSTEHMQLSLFDLAIFHGWCDVFTRFVEDYDLDNLSLGERHDAQDMVQFVAAMLSTHMVNYSDVNTINQLGGDIHALRNPVDETQYAALTGFHVWGD